MLPLPGDGAPLPPLDPVTLSGTIETVKWVKARLVRGRRGATGSLGRDRTFPAHFVVVLGDYRGVDSDQARRLNGLVGAGWQNPILPAAKPRRLTVWINSDDPGWLRPGMAIRIAGYRITGDEGGTWTRHGGVEIRE